MKKIHLICFIILIMINTAKASLINAPASALSSLLDGRLASVEENTEPSAPNVTTSHPVALSSSEGSTFPLPEGMTTPPPVISPAITSAITPVITIFITPDLITTIKEPLPKEVPPSSPPIASFQPVGPPTEISATDFAEIPPATQTNAPLHSNESVTVMPVVTKPKSLTGRFDITSLYVFRGISRSGNSPAFQGNFTYTFLPTGVYLKIWGSNVDFLSRQGQQATVEADTIAGIKNKVGHDFTYDLRMVRYNFAKAAGANYNEFVSFLQYRILTFTLGYSPNALNAHANGLYLNGGFDIPIPEKYTFQYTNVSLFGHYGHYYLSEEVGLRSYSDFLIGLQKVLKPYTFQLSWKGTNGEAHQKGIDANRLVGTIYVDF